MYTVWVPSSRTMQDLDMYLFSSAVRKFHVSNILEGGITVKPVFKTT